MGLTVDGRGETRGVRVEDENWSVNSSFHLVTIPNVEEIPRQQHFISRGQKNILSIFESQKVLNSIGFKQG